MKIILTFLKLLLSIVLQISLLPLRLISWALSVCESICRIIRETNNYLIDKIIFEVVK